MLKKKLLDTGYFIDNSYLTEYLQLVSTGSKATYLERHHILPRAYYNITEQEIDNSDNNLVSLSFADHCKAHWLLYYCTIGRVQYAMQTAFVIMVNGLSKHIKEYTEADFVELQEMKNLILEDSTTFWSAEEDDFLKQSFLEFTDTELADKLNRTEIAIRARRTFLGLQRVKMSDFTDEEVAYIKANYYQKELKEIANALNRSIGSIATKCHNLGLKKWYADPWTEAELEFLYKNSSTMSTAEISVALHRGLAGVQRQCRIHKIKCFDKRPGFWTDGELEYLVNNYTTKAVPRMAKILSRPVSSVRRKCLDLGLIAVQNPRK